MSGNEIREKYLHFMEKNGHAVIPSSALVPDNDPTTLFTGSGMQPLIAFLMGEKHPMGTRLTDSQKCFRADDIEEVGDNRHTTFFEMLGNWSLGDYFKQEQLRFFFTFLVDEVGLDPARIYVSVFAGDESVGVAQDTESVGIWKTLFAERGITAADAFMGSEEDGGKRGIRPCEHIFFYDSGKNWWSRVGKPQNMPVGEIGGPDSEVFYDFGTEHDTAFGPHCHPNCDCGRFLEIGNSVFMEYLKTETGFEKLPQQNVDFGGGLERIAAAALGDSDVFKIDLLNVVITQLESLTGKKYEENKVAFRVVTDHIRGAVFMIGDGIVPANAEQGYFVRRLLRRAVRFADILNLPHGTLKDLAESIIGMYGAHYTNLSAKKADIMATIEEEEVQFRKTLEQGLKQFNKISLKINLPSQDHPDEVFSVPIMVKGKKLYVPKNPKVQGEKHISGKNAFELFTTYGFPIELTEEIAEERGLTVDVATFKNLMEEHRELSRKGAEHKFKGGLADHSEKVVMYHTATHLLLAALRHELGTHVHQAGSNITGERMRFDFTHTDKVDPETLARVEAFVNNAITHSARVSIDTVPKAIAEKDPTIEGSFWERYPDEVKVYTITGNDGTIYSRELCGGPHVEETGAITGTFKIVKEESSSAGVRRIKAVLA